MKTELEAAVRAPCHEHLEQWATLLREFAESPSLATRADEADECGVATALEPCSLAN